jgi:hypothetical protein
VLIVLLGCFIATIFTALKSINQEQDDEGQTNQSDINQENIDLSEINWTTLSDEQMETICLEQAKLLAEDQGYSSTIITGCECQSSKDDESATYDCTVSTSILFYSSIPITVNCVKTGNSCNITAMGESYELGNMQNY